MGKKVYERPVLAFERFVPNEYCAACFTATGTLECEITNVEHGYPCHNTKFTISYENGVLSGKANEMNPDGTIKLTMDIQDINVPCGLEDVESWKERGCDNTTWTNIYENHTYNHRGKCTITSFNYLEDGRPMHS